jgi:hypothetical protein
VLGIKGEGTMVECIIHMPRHRGSVNRIAHIQTHTHL